MNNSTFECAVCARHFHRSEVTSAHLVREPIGELIHGDRPAWTLDSYICRSDLAVYRMKYVHSILESEQGELSQLDLEVLESLKNQELISSSGDADSDQKWTFGERLADRIATFGGSWTFLIMFAVFLSIWIALNSVVLLCHPVDPYPFILLNLVLSCLASIQAPIIMMSQNRQESKDRKRAEHDYKVNLKAELEIRQLHEKLDHLLSKQWERLIQIQEIQMEQLAEINALKKKPDGRGN